MSPNTTARSPGGRRVHSVSGAARASPLILRNGCRRPGRVIYSLLVVRLTLRGVPELEGQTRTETDAFCMGKLTCGSWPQRRDVNSCWEGADRDREPPDPETGSSGTKKGRPGARGGHGGDRGAALCRGWGGVGRWSGLSGAVPWGLERTAILPGRLHWGAGCKSRKALQHWVDVSLPPWQVGARRPRRVAGGQDVPRFWGLAGAGSKTNRQFPERFCLPGPLWPSSWASDLPGQSWLDPPSPQAGMV